jgi:protease-4
MEGNIPPVQPPPLPPVAWSGPAAPARRRATGWKIATVVLAALLMVLLFGALADWMLGLVWDTEADTAGPRLREVVLEDRHTEHKMAVIPVEGLIVGFGDSPYSMVRVIKAQLKAARRDHRVKAVILKIDSPGGEVLAADQISQAIRQFQDETGKPVVASMSSVAASGGYYVAAPCRWIVAHELTITGSIGVILQALNYRGLMDKVGLVPQTFKSGPYKDMLSPTKRPSDITDEERAMIQALVNQTYERFKQTVAEGRQRAAQMNRDAGTPGRLLDTAWTNYADGRVLSGKQAWELGFVDELGDLQTALQRATKLAGIPDASLVEYRPVFDLSTLLPLLIRSDVGRVKVDFGLELPKLRPGYLYFLAPTYLH